MSPEILDLLRRIENWRRCYKTCQRISAVPWYTPPKYGDVYEDVTIGVVVNIPVVDVTNIPIDLKDAMLLERAWRNISSEPIKYFIKQEYIVKMNSNIIRRKLKRYGIVIRDHADYVAFSDTSLDYFLECIRSRSGKTVLNDKMA